MANALLLLGIIFIAIGIAFVAVVAFLGKGVARTEGAVVGFIGPFPIGFATSKAMLFMALGISITLVLAFLLLGR
jgi:uncharacterized membrane protein